MKEIKSYTYDVDTITRDGWDNVITQFSDATLYQTWSYGAIHWGEESLSHIVIKKNDKVESAAQIRIIKLPLFGTKMAYVYRGPMWRKIDEDRNIDNLSESLRIIKSEYVTKRGLFLRVVPNDYGNLDNSISSVYETEGFKRSCTAKPYKTFLLDLTPSIDVLFSGLSKKWRENLRRANRSNLQIVEGNSLQFYDEFMILYNQMHSRKKFIQFVDIEEFKNIQRDLPEELKMKILICEYQSEPVSALVFSHVGDTGIPIFSATGHNGLKLRGSYYLRWHMLEFLKKSGNRHLDQGGIDRIYNPGGYRFKSGMGGDEVDFLGEYEKCNNILLFLMIKSFELLMQYYRKSLMWLNKIMKH